MIKVTVKLYGVLREYANREKPARWVGELPEGADVDTALRAVKCPKEKVILILREGQPLSLEEKILDGDLLYFIANLGIG
jgi:hypothetical protein